MPHLSKILGRETITKEFPETFASSSDEPNSQPLQGPQRTPSMGHMFVEEASGSVHKSRVSGPITAQKSPGFAQSGPDLYDDDLLNMELDQLDDSMDISQPMPTSYPMGTQPLHRNTNIQPIMAQSTDKFVFKPTQSPVVQPTRTVSPSKYFLPVFLPECPADAEYPGVTTDQCNIVDKIVENLANMDDVQPTPAFQTTPAPIDTQVFQPPRVVYPSEYFAHTVPTKKA